MKTMMNGVVVAVLLSLAASTPAAEAARELKQAPAVTDIDILNFALNLEYLEGEFYAFATTGFGLPANLRGGGPASVGGMRATLSPPIQAIATEIATDERNHVAFLRAALGSAAVPIPQLNIGTAFAMAADAALNMTLAPPFSPYTNDTLFLHGAFIFEDVGVTAYIGAAPLISNKTYLGAAAGILAVEAYHAGIIRTKLSEIANQIVVPYGAPVSAVVQAISNLRAMLSQANDDQGIVGTTPGSVNLVPTDANSLAFARTARQVLNIVYGAIGASSGLFFPAGLNGNIK